METITCDCNVNRNWSRGRLKKNKNEAMTSLILTQCIKYSILTKFTFGAHRGNIIFTTPSRGAEAFNTDLNLTDVCSQEDTKITLPKWGRAFRFALLHRIRRQKTR